MHDTKGTGPRKVYASQCGDCSCCYRELQAVAPPGDGYTEMIPPTLFKVTKEYTPPDDDQGRSLTLEEGDEVWGYFRSDADTDWFYGTDKDNSKVGFFFSTFVEAV
mmetsp:Transcript_109721/g.211032  ORF Transcript_109721/g.211032 Transcript_109721/m.211032 type:complete len:106 (-) Transcript_109721:73-390(-)